MMRSMYHCGSQNQRNQTTLTANRKGRTRPRDGNRPVADDAVDVPLLTVLGRVCAVHVERVKHGVWRSDAREVVLHLRAQLSFTALCVTTETRHLDRLGQFGEFEQNSNTDSKHTALCVGNCLCVKRYVGCVFK